MSKVYVSSYSEGGRVREMEADTPAEILESLGLNPNSVIVSIAGVETTTFDQQLKDNVTVVIGQSKTKSGR